MTYISYRQQSRHCFPLPLKEREAGSVLPVSYGKGGAVTDNREMSRRKGVGGAACARHNVLYVGLRLVQSVVVVNM